MAEEKGIQQTKELLDFIFSLAEAIYKSAKDGKFSWTDGLNFIEPLKKIGPAIDDIDKIIPEVMDLSPEEFSELVEYVQSKWEFQESPDDDSTIEDRVEEAINAGIELLRLTKVIKA